MTTLFRFSFDAMASENELQLYVNDRAEASRVAELAYDEVRRIERKFSRYRDDSLLTQINQAAGRHAVAIDSETAALLGYGDACFRKSDGLFDLTSGVLRRCWNFKEARLPEPEHLRATLALVGWDKVHWSTTEIYLPIPGMQLDFGGVGKEYAADRAAALCLNEGIKCGLVNLAGDIRILGPHPDGSAWRIGIKHPRQPNATIASVNLTSGALATSGDYERFFEIAGRRYSHILNAKTGYPVSALQAVSVTAPLCSVAGSLSTIGMLKGRNGPRFLRSENVGFIAVDHDGKIKSKLGSMADLRHHDEFLLI
jgi:FAD:protein FMN transferase